jgi:hypothetical protein
VKCDFHTHSTISDGTLAPGELVDHAAEAGVDVLALTDHDSVEGVAEASARGRARGVQVLGGVELSVSEDDGRRQMHLLGLGVDPAAASLAELTVRLRGAREERMLRMLDALAAQGIALAPERVRALAGPGTVGRPHVARALVESGACADADEAFARWLRRGRPAFVASPGLLARDAIEAIHAAGGLASLAHPPLSVGVDGPGGLDAFVSRLVPLGLDALEVWHPAHTPRRVKRLARLAREHDLVATGGSDFHGANTPERRIAHGNGSIRVGAAAWHALEARLAALRSRQTSSLPSTARCSNSTVER